MRRHHNLSGYLNLVQALINCPRGEEWELLQRNERLVTPELLTVMEEVAAQLLQEGDGKTAKFLRYWEAQLAHVLAQESENSPIDDRLQTSLKLIQALLDCPKGAEAKLLSAHAELLTPEFVQLMQQVAAQLNERGNPDTANFLRQWARELTLPTPAAAPPVAAPPVAVPVEVPPAAVLTETPVETPVEAPLEAPVEAPVEHPVEAPVEPRATGQPSYPSLELQVTAIAQSLAQLERTIASRLQPFNPLWYMQVLEQAATENWLLSTEEVEHLIGVKPKCSSSQPGFQRGCWTFVKTGKMGSQTGWRVMKSINFGNDLEDDSDRHLSTDSLDHSLDNLSDHSFSNPLSDLLSDSSDPSPMNAPTPSLPIEQALAESSPQSNLDTLEDDVWATLESG
ncbi:hypothetical protein [Alkalinema sp. FACHB-956]|uniref:hypothetical protein n=1 Tax=Alkalinema sp. FACHB-956 TaxID=2692768 RepID=UPI001686C129|nr:hypothetical protein [Alkalinema sp. FACHB-956]MBD2327979.1 hypothetical protein [Alkalinema sp. FACHB-956]